MSDLDQQIAAARRKGRAVCDNRLTFPQEETENAILGVIEHVVLTPAFIETVLDRVFVPDDGDRAALEAEQRDLERQIAGMVVWTATTKPAGLLAGLPGSERMASPSGLRAVGPRVGGWLRAA